MNGNINKSKKKLQNEENLKKLRKNLNFTT